MFPWCTQPDNNAHVASQAHSGSKDIEINSGVARMPHSSAIPYATFPTLRNVVVGLAIYVSYGILVPDKAGPDKQGQLHRGCTVGRAVQKLKRRQYN